MCDSNGQDRIIIPPARALEIIVQANKVYLRKCPCRVQEQNCPPDTWEVCMLFESASPDDLLNTRPISTAEALSIFTTAARRNPIYNLFYTHSEGNITELCSCCTCCCHPLNRMKAKANYSEELRSEYIAVTDPLLCMACGACEESCIFEARWTEDGTLHLMERQCFGCGRCIDSCPQGAIRLEREIGRGVPIPTGV
jgi:ferredoxin